MLFDTFRLGKIELKNRVVMAPMTRARNPEGIPNHDNAVYYAQRSEAGLIITEGTAISSTSKGFLNIPGLYTAGQVEGWKLVADAVHKQGSAIFTQLWHVGRISHTSIQPDGQPPVGVSDIQAVTSSAYGITKEGKEGFVPCSKPKALTTEDAKQVIQDFAHAAKNAIAAGLDGVELHGANGYLIEQFLNPFVNTRNDQYGGTLENRCRFLLEATDACIDAIGADRTAIRLTPYGDMHELPHYDSIEATYEYLAKELNARNIAYIHFMDQGSRGSYALPEGFLKRFHQWFRGTVILAGGLDKEKAEARLQSGDIDLAAFGEPFIANPDLVTSMHNNYPLAPTDRATHYGLGLKGYTDYKFYENQTL
ncbi:alkene reductase [Flavobacterium subsaxonicum]|uniref:NADH:flavin oxidoreductase n=1 Tax=Flavobacterium subsaxonicum WB 4.1-42 = DSM 21790 TaxID=1121898 RepID=A0A0A2MMQ8_9FLAO|nr:alkene reductase [Flavobacterium subsaxonicum]KGO93594.1 NADH:flavin oxidoreductase [Flavobacterium subsaxonicum WB 4.1-42 = DSM 21790]